jgi:hypothetical protein
MWRTLLCLGLLVVFTGFVAGDDKEKAGRFMRGQIVRVNPDQSTIVVRTGTGTEAKEHELKVTEQTKYFGTDKQPLAEGLKFTGLKPGTDVWFKHGDQANTIAELRMYDPSKEREEKK